MKVFMLFKKVTNREFVFTITKFSECNDFTNYDAKSVKTVNCNRTKCAFKCKKGFELINSGPVKCVVDEYGIPKWNNSKLVTCIRKY